MSERPPLNNGLDSATFQSYYFLKEELIRFCRSEGLQTTGSKAELTERISRYLDTGEKLTAIRRAPRPPANSGQITVESLIESDFVCSERHRAFFKEKIGKSFSFNVAFQNWLKANTGKSYADAIEAYHRILAENRRGKTTVDRQFEYNAYIRDFFADNESKSLDDAIKCWKYKKGVQGHNRYEKSDLITLS